MTTTYSIDFTFVVDIPIKEDYIEVEPIDYKINCHKYGSKFYDNRTGGVLINQIHNLNQLTMVTLGKVRRESPGFSGLPNYVFIEARKAIQNRISTKLISV